MGTPADVLDSVVASMKHTFGMDRPDVKKESMVSQKVNAIPPAPMNKVPVHAGKSYDDIVSEAETGVPAGNPRYDAQTTDSNNQ